MKTPNQKSLDELISVLDDTEVPDQNGTENFEDEMLKFISIYNFEPGKEKVDSRILMRLYNRTFNADIRKGQFTTRFGLYFDGENNNNKRTFFLNKSAIKISQTLYEKLKVKKKRKSTSPAYRRHFEKFINDKGIKQGSFYVESYVLFFMYDEWCFNRKIKRRFAVKPFAEFLSLYLKVKRTSGKVNSYGIDRKSVGDYLNDDRLKIIKEWGIKFYDRQKKNAQKSKKVSSTRSINESKDKARLD